MTAVDVAAIRAALEAATPGPWAMGAYGPGQEHVAYTSPRAAEEGIEEHTVSAYVPFVKDEECQPNAELIVLLRNNAEALLRMLDETVDERDYWRGMARLVAHDPERYERQGAVKALRDLAESNFYDGDSDRPCDGYNDLIDRAEAIENGLVSP